MGSSESVFDERIINIGLWPHSPNLKPCNQFFYSWGMRIVYSNNPHIEDDLKINSETKVPSISPAEYFTCNECVF